MLTCGHIGVLGRAGIFLFAAILFFRTIRDVVGGNKTVFGNALSQLQSTSAGCAALFIMGFFVVIYGLFAVLNVYARVFPTPPPVSCSLQAWTLGPCDANAWACSLRSARPDLGRLCSLAFRG